MKKYADSEQTIETTQLKVVQATCVAAQHFFKQAAQQVADGNLRYKFSELSTLHSNAAQYLPADSVPEQPQNINRDLAAVQFWYLHQKAALHSPTPPPEMLCELDGLLQQQLSALKRLTNNLQSHNAKITLAHLSAGLQIACDQLQPMLKVLPADGKNLQTKN